MRGQWDCYADLLMPERRLCCRQNRISTWPCLHYLTSANEIPVLEQDDWRLTRPHHWLLNAPGSLATGGCNYVPKRRTQACVIRCTCATFEAIRKLYSFLLPWLWTVTSALPQADDHRQKCQDVACQSWRVVCPARGAQGDDVTDAQASRSST